VLRSTLRDPSFYHVILHVFSEIFELGGSETFEKLIKCWRRGWRGRWWRGWTRRKYTMLAKSFVARKGESLYIIGCS
jgi:hypothetical protein